MGWSPLLFEAAVGRFVDATTHAMMGGLRSTRMQIACFAVAVAGLLTLFVIEPFPVEEAFATGAPEAGLWNEVDQFEELDPSPLTTDSGRSVRVLYHASED